MFYVNLSEYNYRKLYYNTPNTMFDLPCINMHILYTCTHAVVMNPPQVMWETARPGQHPPGQAHGKGIGTLVGLCLYVVFVNINNSLHGNH